jgi:hypothetical protein
MLLTTLPVLGSRDLLRTLFETEDASACSPRVRIDRDVSIPAQTKGLQIERADARTRTGDPSLRVKRVQLVEPRISLQIRESCETAESVEVHRSPQRSSDVFQRCSNLRAPRQVSDDGVGARPFAGVWFETRGRR